MSLRAGRSECQALAVGTARAVPVPSRSRQPRGDGLRETVKDSSAWRARRHRRGPSQDRSGPLTLPWSAIDFGRREEP